jgi:hypothetical protein
MTASIVELNHEVGVSTRAAKATLDACVVRTTQLDMMGMGGRGVHVDYNMNRASELSIARSLIELNYEAAVFAFGATVSIESSLFRDMLANATGSAGAGVVLVSDMVETTASIRDTRIERSALVAVAAWGAHGTIESSALVCQTIDLNTETYQGRAAKLEDLGGNLCGCPEANAPCKALSANLQPPPQLEDPPE